MKVLMNLLTSILFRDTPDVIIEEVTIEENMLIFTLQSTRFCGECPACGFASTKVHGSYVRKPADLPCLTYCRLSNNFHLLILPRICGREKVSDILFSKEGKDHAKGAKDLYTRV